MRQIPVLVWRRLGRLNLGVLAALALAAAAAVVYFAAGSQMFSPGHLKAEPRVHVPRGGVQAHAELTSNCAACHPSPWSGVSMADLCLDCHGNIREQLAAEQPLHGRFPEAADCRSCHTEHKGPNAVVTSMAKFNHDFTAYPLTGAHRRVDCEKCHVNPGYQGTARDCRGCHAEPPVHQGKFGNACEQCHSTLTWVSTPGSRNGTSFDHNLTKFALTGKHQAVACSSCHVKDSFLNTDSSCVSCHAEPVIHAGRFGTNCAACHLTYSWDGAAFDHSFLAVTHRQRRDRPNTCQTCHKDPSNYSVSTCIDCHRRTSARVAQMLKPRVLPKN